MKGRTQFHWDLLLSAEIKLRAEHLIFVTKRKYSSASHYWVPKDLQCFQRPSTPVVLVLQLLRILERAEPCSTAKAPMKLRRGTFLRVSHT